MPAVPPADADRIRHLVNDPARWVLACLASTGSTNADLAALAKEGAAEGTVLVAEHQTGGRGRFARSWVDTPGTNIAMSVLLRPRREPQAWGWLPLVAGLAVADALASAGGVATDLKWPNDVLVASGPRPGKLCGILAALEPTADGPACILGIGINVAMADDELPVPTATSLGLCGGRTDKSAVVAAVLDALAGWYDRWQAAEDLRAPYEERCATVGRRVRVQLDAEQGRGEVTEGVATGVDADGSLQVMVGTHVVTVSAGDALHVR